MKFTTHFELHSQTTRLVEEASHGFDPRSHTGFSPSMTPCSNGLRPRFPPKHSLQITTRTPKGPDFKFELLPLHSPLLRQSLLVSFPPLIDMLKFSGYPYLIRGQLLKARNWVNDIRGVAWRAPTRTFKAGLKFTTLKVTPDRHCFSGTPRGREPNTKPSLRGVMTLEQACPPEYRGAQCAFKDSMIH